MARTPRKFNAEIAKRSKTPLLVSLIGPSGSGKTYSALRLAAGFKRVVGGKIFAIDTESGRMKHYADKFEFVHVPFTPPFGSLDYLDAIRQCVTDGASVIVIDSMSHEHDGEGGHLESRDAEWTRLGREEKNNFTSWVAPKADRNKLVQYIVQCNVCFVFCFRAKEKIRPAARGSASRAPEKLGLQPVGGKDFLFEMMCQAILPSGCDGFPQWNPDEPAARSLIKVPSQFRDLLTGSKSQLSEDIGEEMAKWANGGAPPVGNAGSQVDMFIAQLERCMDHADLEELRSGHGRTLYNARATSSRDKQRLAEALQTARQRVADMAATFADDEEGTAERETGDEPEQPNTEEVRQ